MQITQLLETIRLKHNPEESSVIIFNLNLHTERLLKSLLELKFEVKDHLEIHKNLFNKINNYFSKPEIKIYNGSFNYDNQEKNIYKLRLLYNIDGEIEIEISIYERFLENNVIHFSLSKDFKINSKDKQWQYKFFPREETNLKKLLNNHTELFSENSLDEILWTNEKNEICEGSFTNLFLRKKNIWITPHLESNLLNGTMRKILMSELKASEEKCYIDELSSADEIIFCNSMIGKAKAELINHPAFKGIIT